MEIQDKEEVNKSLPTATQHKLWLGTYVSFALGCLALHFIARFRILNIFGSYQSFLLRLSLAGTVIFAVLTVSVWIEKIIKKKSHTKAIRYNMVRVARLITIIILLLIIISFINENWYTAAVSLGLFSLILGFALQTPISSLIGWIYIVFRLPYKVGDRIQLAEFTGDVVEIGYLDTTLWEFGGNYMTNDVPSGRLIRFPNSMVLQSAVFNYSWKKFPYIWNEIPFHVAYESDLDFVETTIKKIAKEEIGEKMADNVQLMKDYLKETAVDELEIKDYPFVNFRINANTWVEVLLVYLVPPKKAAFIRTLLIKTIIAELLKEPDKVMFPKTNSR